MAAAIDYKPHSINTAVYVRAICKIALIIVAKSNQSRSLSISLALNPFHN